VTTSRSPFEHVIVGGGLQAALLALALRERQPGASVAIVERAPALGGNHTWSFHEGDVPAGARTFVEPLVVRRSPAYDVRFPGLSRTVSQSYATITSARLDEVVRERLSGGRCAVRLGVEAVEVGPRVVRLADGSALEGRLVVDARGPAPVPPGSAGFQKFVGVELRLDGGRAPERPVVMDATVPQADGFRFVYLLPLAPDRVLVEDTYFSTDAALDRATLRARAVEYARGLGLEPFTVEREEEGVLPLPWKPARTEALAAPLRAGYAGGWFHPVTGYSFPVAVRLATLLASLPADRAIGPELAALAREHRAQSRFAHLLNWMMFNAYSAADRWHVLERFYREMPEDTIMRFYALAMTWRDRARLVSGRPPRGFSLRLALSRRAA
jgi:lycopene beta-cyclase